MSKAKLPAILLNNDFFLKPRNRKWLADNGAEALVILLAFWTASSQETSCKIRKEEVAYINFPLQLKPEKILSILNSAVSVGLLDEDSDCFFNSQILNDSKSFLNKRANYSKGHEKRKQIQDESKLNPERNQTKSKLDFTDTDTEYETDTEELKKKEYHIDLPCLKLERNEWDAWLLNFHHGNEAAAREMCVAASDSLQGRGMPVPADCMAYMRQWFKRSPQFQAHPKIAAKPPEPQRPRPPEAKPLPKAPPLTEAQRAENRRMVENLLTKTGKAVAV